MRDGWSIHLLAEYFSAVSAPHSEQAAVEAAVSRAAEALDAEVGAVVIDGEVRGSWGLGTQSIPADLASVTPGTRTVVVPGVGVLDTAVGEFGQTVSGALIVGRAGARFGPWERQLLHAMAQLLGLALHG